MKLESARPSQSLARQRLCAVLTLVLAVSPCLPAVAQQQGQQAAPPATAPAADSNTAIGDSPLAPMAPMQASLSTATPLTHDEQVLMVLNRFAYGPRPGDLERIRAEGISKWFEQQLNPASIDDSALDRRLADYPAMQLPLVQLMQDYPDQQMIRATLNGRINTPHGDGESQLYKAQMQRYEDRQNAKKNGQDGRDSDNGDADPLPATPEAIVSMEPGPRFTLLSKLTPAQLRTLRRALSPADRDRLTEGFKPRQLEVLAAFNGPPAMISSELVQTKLLRSIFSERQLNEVMTDFWLNHFNVYLRKSQQAPYLITAYERDTIRPRALSTFENILVATAASPAMLTYLDNAASIGPDSEFTHPNVTSERYSRFPRPVPKDTGLNENYARELMELHTLGVNGGYTQKDVMEVAKVFTGWTLGRGYDQGPPLRVEFDPRKHEPGDKMVLGHRIKQGGQAEGFEVLHLLATSPQTARFISTELAVRFVSDEPAAALIDRMTSKFLETRGDIRQVLVAMVNSPEFFTRATYRDKVKTPEDYVISAVRASGAEVESAGALAGAVAELGMPIFGMQTPNGYSMKADPWNNTTALISRMNFALALSSNRVAGVGADWTQLLAEPSAADLRALSPQDKDRLLEQHLLHEPVSERTRQTILAQLNTDPASQQASLNQISSKTLGRRDTLSTLRAGESAANRTPVDPQTALAAGLLFGSPEFQRR